VTLAKEKEDGELFLSLSEAEKRYVLDHRIVFFDDQKKEIKLDDQSIPLPTDSGELGMSAQSNIPSLYSFDWDHDGIDEVVIQLRAWTKISWQDWFLILRKTKQEEDYKDVYSGVVLEDGTGLTRDQMKEIGLFANEDGIFISSLISLESEVNKEIYSLKFIPGVLQPEKHPL
jgi:hypothetical protein